MNSYNFVQNLFDDFKASVNKIFSRVELVKMMWLIFEEQHASRPGGKEIAECINYYSLSIKQLSNHSLDVSIFFSKSRAKQILQSAGKPKQTACHLFIGVEVDVNKHLKKSKD